MMDFLVETTFWAVIFILALVIGAWVGLFKHQKTSGPSLSLIHRVLSSYVFLAFLGMGSLWIIADELDLGYVAPRDIMQDIVSARELLKGNSLYPSDMTNLIKNSLELEAPKIAFGRYLPRFRTLEESENERVITSHWVQAHPPPMTVFFVPFVAAFGIRGTFLAISSLSIGALCLALILLQRGLAPMLTKREICLLIFAGMGWFPVVSVIRNGQSGILLSTLVILSWFWLRRGHSTLAGIPVGIAASLKLYPGLLIPYLLLRSRRAFIAAVLTAVVCLLIPVAVSGWNCYLDYFRTASLVTRTAGTIPLNLSLLGLAEKISALALGGNLRAGFGVYVFLSLTILVVLGLLMVRRSGSPLGITERVDLEFSIVVILIPLLSPLAWHHYLPIILLPLAILGSRVISGETGWGAWAALLVLLAILSEPDWMIYQEFSLGKTVFGWRLSSFFWALPTLAILLVLLWLLWLYERSCKRVTGIWPGALECGAKAQIG